MTAERALVALGPADEVQPVRSAPLTLSDREGTDTCSVTVVTPRNREERRHPERAPRLTVDDLTGDTCSVEEAAICLGIGRNLAYQLAREKELPGVLHLGRLVRVSVRGLRAFLGADG